MRRNIVISFLQKHVQLVVAVGSVFVLSRLISPEETGVYSIGVAIAALTHAIRDFGVGNFLIKEVNITVEKIRTAFTVSLIIAITLGVGLLAVSYPVAKFYGNPEVAAIIWITTLGLVISPFSTVGIALMLRNQRFGDMFKVSIAAAIANAVVAITMALLGFGAKSLALGALASSVCLVLASNMLSHDNGIYRFSLSSWRQISRFGMHMTIFGVSEQLGQRASDLILGKLVGFGAVGLLSRAGTLINMVQDSVISSVMPVVLTTMAGDNRKSGDLSPLLLRSLSFLTVVLWPVFAVLSIFAHDAVLVLFGQKWIEAAPYTSVLCYGASLAVLSSLVGTTCNAADRADLLSRYSTLAQGMRVILIAVGAAMGGLRAVVIMLVIAEAFQCVLAYFYVRQAATVSLSKLLQTCWRSVAVTAMVTGTVLPISMLTSYSPIVRLGITALTASVAWITAAFIVQHPITNELRVITATVAQRVRAYHART